VNLLQYFKILVEEATWTDVCLYKCQISKILAQQLVPGLRWVLSVSGSPPSLTGGIDANVDIALDFRLFD
jgi:hypothetical protein